MEGTSQLQKCCFNALGAGDEARENESSAFTTPMARVSMPSVRAMRLARPGQCSTTSHGNPHVSMPSVRAMRLARITLSTSWAFSTEFQCPRCGR